MLKQRSLQKELLDAEDIPTADLFQTLRELDRINTLLGGYDITFSALKKVVQPEKNYILIDIGCGGGDTLKRIQEWQLRKKLKLKLIGIDLKPVCIEYATEHKARPNIQFICDDYRNMFEHVPQIDIIHACLFCHHLEERQLIELIQFAMDKNAVLIINDLERNWFAPCQRRLTSGQISALHLYGGQGRRYSLTGAARWRFWRRSRPVSQW